jgi:hypothetical protein
VVGKVSPWIDPDSANALLRQDSAAALKQELAWAAHLGLQAVILPCPPGRTSAVNYAQLLSRALAGLSNMALWVRIPLVRTRHRRLRPAGRQARRPAAGQPPARGRGRLAALAARPAARQ